jgi:hypothetical protein
MVFLPHFSPELIKPARIHENTTFLYVNIQHTSNNKHAVSEKRTLIITAYENLLIARLFIKLRNGNHIARKALFRDAQRGPINKGAIIAMFNRYGFASLPDKLSIDKSPPKTITTITFRYKYKDKMYSGSATLINVAKILKEGSSANLPEGVKNDYTNLKALMLYMEMLTNFTYRFGENIRRY